MAGAGYKLFASGDVLTAAQVNTYLQEQAVMVFASAAARTTAISGVLAEGMVTYLQDTNTMEVYDGANWIPASLTNSFYAAKNKILNSDFSIWQRGTSFTNPTTGAYTADRWRTSNTTADPTSRTITRETFTPGTAPVSGYEGQYFLRSSLTTIGSCTVMKLNHRIEDVRTFAGQTMTLSFWAKSDTTRVNTYDIIQSFGSGGSSAVTVLADTNFTTTTSWQRFTVTVAVPSVSGKTIGTSSFLQVTLGQNITNGSVLDIWGVQVEAGSVATAFQTATGTLQGEIAACQRYYEKSYNQDVAPGTVSTPGYVFKGFGASAATSGTTGYLQTDVRWKVEKRAAPTLTIYDAAGTSGVVTAENPGGAATNGNALYTSNIGTSGAQIGRDGASGTRTSTNTIGFHYVASSEL